MTRNGDLFSAKFLCESSLSSINTLGEKSRTPLHFAVLSNSVEVAAMLIKYGADIEKRLLIDSITETTLL